MGLAPWSVHSIIGKCSKVLKFVLEGNESLKYFNFYLHFRTILEHGDDVICECFLQLIKTLKEESFQSKYNSRNMLNLISLCYSDTAYDKETRQRQGDIIKCTLNFLKGNPDILDQQKKKAELKSLYNIVHAISSEHEGLLILLAAVLPKTIPEHIG